MLAFSADYEEDEWPDILGETKAKLAQQSHHHNGNSQALATDSPKRFAVRKRTDSCLYNMASLLSSVAAGFDIRISNTNNSVHPSLDDSTKQQEGEPSGSKSKKKNRHSAHIGQRRDAYNAAVRDSFLNPTSDSYDFSVSSGFMHNTYHGQQAKVRPSVNFDVPIRFAEAQEEFGSGYHADVHNSTTPSSDNRTTPSAESHYSGSANTPSISGTSFSGASLSPRIASSDENNYNELALISLSPSQDKDFIQIQRQMSDTSSSAFETPMTTPKSTPQRYNIDTGSGSPNMRLDDSPNIRSPSVKFNERVRYQESASSSIYSHRRSPSNTSNTSIPGVHDGVRHPSSGSGGVLGTGDTPTPLRPPPPTTSRRQSIPDISHHGSTAERPVTLDIIPRPRPAPISILKKTSPAHTAGLGYHCSPRGKVTPTPSDMSGDDSYLSARSGTSPGSTPPHIEHHRTLLDIDVEGQQNDRTQPLPTIPDRHPTISELETEFL